MGEQINKQAGECQSMDDVRVEIDRLDKELVKLIAQRFSYVDRAWQLKNNPEDAVVPWRIQEVINKVKMHAEAEGLDETLAEALWRQMIGWFIQYEETRLKEKDPQG